MIYLIYFKLLRSSPLILHFFGVTSSLWFNQLTLQEARAYAEENGLFFMETSAKTATNVNDIFYEIGTHLVSLVAG